MTDLDKMSRELLADQYECDLPGSEIAQRLRGRFEGQLRVADIIALAAIRTALLTAPPGYVLVPVEPTDTMVYRGGEYLHDTLGRMGVEFDDYAGELLQEIAEGCFNAMNEWRC